MTKKFALSTICLTLLIVPQTAAAIPPPDFLINVGSQVAQFFSIALLFLSAIAVTLKDYLKVFFQKIGLKKVGIGITIIGILVLAGIASLIFQSYEQQKSLDEWQQKSQAAQQDTAELLVPLSERNNQRLENSNSEITNPELAFLNQYYNYLNQGKLTDAYAVSSQNVPFSTYSEWYTNITNVTISDITRVNAAEPTYLVTVTLTESNGHSNTYRVTQTLSKESNGSFKISQSSSSLLSADISADNNELAPLLPEKTPAENAITNSDFQKILNEKTNVYILDAREDEEYNLGNIPGSTHIRYADLVAGKWQSLPKDQPVYVICWSGIRGQEVTSFLNDKGLNAIYLLEGANSWVEFGGSWQGEISFSAGYPQPAYRQLFTTEEVKSAQNDGKLLLDTRSSISSKQYPIAKAIEFPLIEMDSLAVKKFLNELPESPQEVITICNDFVSCFAAKIVGIKVNEAGHTFLGRYNKPWEW